MLGARSTLETAVGSWPNWNTTSTSTTKTATERIAVRERNSTSRSLDATAQAWRSMFGYLIAIVLTHLFRTASGARSKVHESPHAHECDVRCEFRPFIDIVGHKYRGPAFGGLLAQNLPQLRGSHSVQPCKGLVQEQYAGVMYQRPRDGGSLYQAARQLVDPAMFVILQTEAKQEIVFAEQEFTLRYVVQRRPKTQILPKCQLPVQLRLVPDPADGAAAAIDLCASPLWLDQPCENFEEGGLAGAVGTEHGKRLAGLHAEGNVVEGPDRTEAVAQSLSQQHRSRPRARSVRRV